MTIMNCRHCSAPLEDTFLDLGFAPPSNAYLSASDLSRPELTYPLVLQVCKKCWLVQTKDYAQSGELFAPDYAYFSSTSTSWLAHAKAYCNAITQRLHLRTDSFVIEVASNDGYLLRNFVDAGVPCLGVEPTASTAAAAERLGIPVKREFFGHAMAERLVAEHRPANLVIGNNVFAHVPDINDFSAGLAAALAREGTLTLEFPHLMRLIEHGQFDTVYHEHFSYLSLYSAMKILGAAGLRVYEVEELSTHGGSLRLYACHRDASHADHASVARLLSEEDRRGLRDIDTYRRFQPRAEKIKNDFVAFLIEQKRAGARVAAYGAAAKGNTLLNYSGVKPDLLPYVCDAAASKQGKFLPGSHIPILDPRVLPERRPDFIVVFPWNIAAEVTAQQAQAREWGAKFVVAVPELRTF